MPTTPPMDNKQEPSEHTTDPVGPDLGEESLLMSKSRFSMDEIKENFNDLEPFVSSQRISMHQVAAAMKALAHKRESTEEELECKQKD